MSGVEGAEREDYDEREAGVGAGFVVVAVFVKRNRVGGVNDNTEPRFCSCKDWEPCGCRHQPLYHCMWCCLELNPEQFAEAQRKGFYPQALGNLNVAYRP